MTFLIMLPVVSLSLLMIPLSTLSVICHLICINNYGWLLNLNLTNKTLQTGARNSLLISIPSFEWPNNSAAINAKTDASVLEEKSSFKMLGLPFTYELDWSIYTISIAVTVSKKNRLILWSFFFLRSLFVSLNLPYDLGQGIVVMFGLVPLLIVTYVR